MARNAVRRTAQGNEQELDESERAPEDGGTPGVPSTDSGMGPNPVTAVTMPGDKIVRDARDPASEAAPAPRSYEVQGGPYTVMWNNFQYKIQHGEILSEHTHDIPRLRKQGVRMQLLQRDEEPAT
jgi:hypothetical protein